MAITQDNPVRGKPVPECTYTFYKIVYMLDFIGARMMDEVVTAGAIRRAKLQSNHHHQHSTLYRPDALPVA